MFKRSTGLPPHQYVLTCRIGRAKALLAENKLPIEDIADGIVFLASNEAKYISGIALDIAAGGNAHYTA